MKRTVLAVFTLPIWAFFGFGFLGVVQFKQIMTQSHMVDYYYKPSEICQINDQVCEPNPRGLTAQDQKQHIETHFKQKGFQLRKAHMDDLQAVFDLRNRHYETPNTYTPHWFYQLSTHGQGVVVENHSQIVGYQFESIYQAEEKIACNAGVLLDQAVQGLHLGKKLVLYSLLGAMEKRAVTSEGIIATDNYASISIFINHMGGYFHRLITDFHGYGPRLVYKIPLTPKHLIGSVINKEKLKHYLNSHREGVDFMLPHCHDLKTIGFLLNNRSFKIVAFLEQGELGSSDTFLALPHHKLSGLC